MMDAIRIVTDSTSDIPPAIAEDHGVVVVPLTVTIDGESFKDQTLTQEAFFERMRAAASLPTTSQPSVGEFVEVYARCLEDAAHVISVHVSSALSGTIESAREAAKRFAGRVTVFDSLNLAWGEALQVLEAAKAVRAGVDLSGVLQALEAARSRVRMIVGLDKLDNLARGGRIGAVSAFLGGLLDLKVTLTVNERGALEPVGRSRGQKAALEHTLRWVAEQMGDHRRGIFAVMHALAPDRAAALADRLHDRYDIEELYVVEAGSVIATHTGTGWGVALLPTG